MARRRPVLAYGIAVGIQWPDACYRLHVFDPETLILAVLLYNNKLFRPLPSIDITAQVFNLRQGFRRKLLVA